MVFINEIAGKTRTFVNGNYMNLRRFDIRYYF